jgi:N-acetylneuraminate synthase
MKINGRDVGASSPTYFIADVAANHDGSLDRALELMTLAKAAGADAAKFQHFRADHIVSDKGFRELGGQQSHQATWSKSVYEVYKDASLPWDWTKPLADHAASIGIDFLIIVVVVVVGKGVGLLFIFLILTLESDDEVDDEAEDDE